MSVKLPVISGERLIKIWSERAVQPPFFQILTIITIPARSIAASPFTSTAHSFPPP